MKNIIKHIFILAILLTFFSCEKGREVKQAPDFDFSFAVIPVDGEYNIINGAVQSPAAFEVLITSGEITDYDLEYRIDGGDLHKMHKLWPGVKREIPVYLSEPGSCEISCSLARADGRSAKKAVRERVYMRGPDVNQVSCRLTRTVSAGSKRNIPLEEEGAEPLYRWDTCKVDISVLPSTEYELMAFSSDPSVLEVISFDQKTDKNYGTASLSFTARKEGEASLTIQVLNGSQVFPFKKDLSVTEDLAVLDYAVKLSSAHIVCNDATDSWKAYHDAEIRAEFSAINPGVGHNLTLSIDGVKVCEKDEWFISGGRFSTSLFWDEIATAEGLVLSEGEHNFAFSAARCDGMDEDAFTGKFVVEDTGLGIQKAEFKYQDTTGEWQMYRPGVVMVDFSLVNMESLHKVTFSIDGTDVYTKEHVRFSEGVAPGETATTYQISLDWNATAALVDLAEGEHSFKLLVEREDGHSKAAYDGKFTVVDPGVYIESAVIKSEGGTPGVWYRFCRACLDMRVAGALPSATYSFIMLMDELSYAIKPYSVDYEESAAVFHFNIGYDWDYWDEPEEDYNNFSPIQNFSVDIDMQLGNNHVIDRFKGSFMWKTTSFRFDSFEFGSALNHGLIFRDYGGPSPVANVYANLSLPPQGDDVDINIGAKVRFYVDSVFIGEEDVNFSRYRTQSYYPYFSVWLSDIGKSKYDYACVRVVLVDENGEVLDSRSTEVEIDVY